MEVEMTHAAEIRHVTNTCAYGGPSMGKKIRELQTDLTIKFDKSSTHYTVIVRELNETFIHKVEWLWIAEFTGTSAVATPKSVSAILRQCAMGIQGTQRCPEGTKIKQRTSTKKSYFKSLYFHYSKNAHTTHEGKSLLVSGRIREQQTYGSL
jgi:hypothetical protein